MTTSRKILLNCKTGKKFTFFKIENKVKSYFNEMLTLKSQLVLQESAYKNYLTLHKGEELRFQAGESSLFLISARESKTLEALQKIQELKVKYIKAEVALQWSSGTWQIK